MSIKVLAIINPTSGKGKITEKIEKIKQNLEQNDMEVEIELTQKGYNAKDIIEEKLHDQDLVLVCGGDGTLNETITAFMENEIKDISLTFIPFGTTNDLARTLHIPIKDISVTEKILESKARLIDIGKFNENKYFCYVAAFGVITDVAYETSQKAKHRFGRLAYYAKAIKELIHIPTYHIHVEHEGKIWEDEVIYGGISNSESIAGFRWFAPGEILLDDGKFECILIKKPKKWTGYFSLLKSFWRKDYTDNKYIHYIQTNEIKIMAEQNIKWTVDGEFAGEQKNVKIENMQKKIEMTILDN